MNITPQYDFINGTSANNCVFTALRFCGKGGASPEQFGEWACSNRGRVWRLKQKRKRKQAGWKS